MFATSVVPKCAAFVVGVASMPPPFCVCGEGFRVLVECALSLVCRCLQCRCLDELDCPNAGFASGAQASAKAGASHEQLLMWHSVRSLCFSVRFRPVSAHSPWTSIWSPCISRVLPCGLRALSDPRASAREQCPSNVAKHPKETMQAVAQNRPRLGQGPANARPTRPRLGEGPARARPAPSRASARPRAGQCPAMALPAPGQRPASARPAPGHGPARARPGPGQRPVVCY